MKKYSPVCNILGVDVSVTSMKETIEYITNNLPSIKGRYICVSNVHTVVTAHDDKKYLNVQNNALMVLPDGKPLSVLQKRRGFKNAMKVSGPDLMPEIFELSNDPNKKQYTHYFYGSTPDTLVKLRNNLEKKYPNLQIKGMYSPPFRELTEKEDEDIINMINEADADFLWVGLGAPKQEFFMANHQNVINSLMLGVGAAFDFHAGTVKRAPKWMQKVGAEWLYRLLQDPKRLWKRYVTTNSKFIWYIISKK